MERLIAGLTVGKKARFISMLRFGLRDAALELRLIVLIVDVWRIFDGTVRWKPIAIG